MDQTKELLTRQIDTEIQSLATMEAGSEAKASAIEGLNKLYKLKLEEIKLENEQKLAEDRLDSEIISATSNLSEQKKSNRVHWVLDAAGIVLPLAFSCVWMAKGFKFETEGTYTSQTFRSLWNRFKPFK